MVTSNEIGPVALMLEAPDHLAQDQVGGNHTLGGDSVVGAVAVVAAGERKNWNPVQYD